MCGIVGYVGGQNASAILIEGLKRLEYRGYDSAGVAVLHDQAFDVVKRTGRVDVVARAVAQRPPRGRIGISHTRWATHGGVTDANAHPHVSWDGKISLVHNGVIENYLTLRRELEGQGVTFRSETDTEVLVNLIAYIYAAELASGPDNPEAALMAAVRAGLLQVEGAYGIALICVDLPQSLIGARKGSPLVVGVGKGENFIASDVMAFNGRTANVVYLEDGQIVSLTPDNFAINTIDAVSVKPRIDTISLERQDFELGGFPHYMLKEIFEQPAAL